MVKGGWEGVDMSSDEFGSEVSANNQRKEWTFSTLDAEYLALRNT
jgi:hypothetical protein